MPKVKTTEEINATRGLILDATEAIMLDEGYAAVSSRRVASAAGLKSQLVHYHFGTMDELFLAVYYRLVDRYIEKHEKALSSKSPLSAFWKLNTDARGRGLVCEFSALANHRDSIRKEIAATTRRIRRMQTGFLEKALKDKSAFFDSCPPEVLSLLIAGATLQLVSEKSVGVYEAHKATEAFVKKLIASLES